MPDPEKQFSVILRARDNPNDPVSVHSARLRLPATSTEILDVLHRLGRERLDDGIIVLS